MKKVLLKIAAAFISVLAGLIIIPIHMGELRAIKGLPLLIVFFLPWSVVILISFFETITRIEKLKFIFRFIQTRKMYIVFLALLLIEWLLLWKVDDNNDVVFVSLFATSSILTISLYNWFGKKWSLFYYS